MGEKEIKLSKAKCFLLPNKSQYLHNDTWKALEKKNGSFFISSSANKVSLKVSQMYAILDIVYDVVRILYVRSLLFNLWLSELPENLEQPKFFIRMNNNYIQYIGCKTNKANQFHLFCFQS